MTRTADPFDDVAAMFMTGGEDSGRATVELLIVGHLPVRAGLWLAPYADAVAREAGATALVRLDGDEAMIHVLRGASGALPVEACRNLRESILHLGSSIRTWIVRPPFRAGPAELLGVGTDRITILSSADQVAVANAYTLVKGLVEEARRAEAVIPEFGLAIIGADRARAEQVQAQISRTTREHLQLDVPLVRCVPRIEAALEPGPLRSFTGHARPDLDEVIAWIDAARASGSGPMGSDPKVPGPMGSDPTADPVPAQPAPTPPAPPAEPEASRGPWPGPLEDLRAAGALKLAPKATAQVEPKEPAPAREPSADGAPVPLAAHVPGLSPIVPRCPGHERVELAVDEQGITHLLAREDDLRSLTVVAAWARAHRELLAMACPEHRFDPRGATASHLFTDEPVKVSDLHGGDVCLHLLAPVTVQGRRGWFATALYAPR